MQKLLKLNIGCGTHYRSKADDEWIYCDIHPGPTADVLFDCTKQWPFPDNSVGSIRCNHVLEHLENFRGFFKEAHRVLNPGGHLIITVPYGFGTGGFCDVTHVKYWLPGSFTFLQPGYGESVFNPQHDEWPAPFDVEVCLLRVNGGLRRLLRWPLRKIGLAILPFLADVYCEVTAFLRPLKSPEAIENFKSLKPGNSIALHRVMHKYEYEGKSYTGGPVEIVFLDAMQVGFISTGDLIEQLVKPHNERAQDKHIGERYNG